MLASKESICDTFNFNQTLYWKDNILCMPFGRILSFHEVLSICFTPYMLSTSAIQESNSTGAGYGKGNYWQELPSEENHISRTNTHTSAVGVQRVVIIALWKREFRQLPPSGKNHECTWRNNGIKYIRVVASGCSLVQYWWHLYPSCLSVCSSEPKILPKKPPDCNNGNNVNKVHS